MMPYDSIVSYRMNNRLKQYEQRRKELEARIEWQGFKYRLCREMEDRLNILFLAVRGTEFENRATIRFREYEKKLHEARLEAYSDEQQFKRELEILDAQAVEAREVLGVVDLEVI